MFKRYIIVLVLSILCFYASAYDFEYKGLYYNVLNDSDVELTFFSNKESEQVSVFPEKVEIPNTVKYMDKVYNVTQIGNKTFMYSTTLKSIFIPDNIFAINNQAFTYCTSLEHIVISDSTSPITLGYQGTDYRVGAECGLFSDCPIKYIYIGREVEYSFYTGSYLKCPFVGISNLEELSFGPNVKTIKDGLFYNCSGPETLFIPSTVDSIGLAAFEWDYAYKTCNIKNLIFEPSSNSLELTYPTNVGSTSIGWFPNSIECFDMERNIWFPVGPGRDNVFYWGWTTSTSNLLLKKLIVGDNVTFIRRNSFYCCTQLEEIEFGSNLSSIQYRAFYGCRNVTKISIKNQNPPICETNAVDYMASSNCTLYVPIGSLNSYKNSDQWTNFYIKEHDYSDIQDVIQDISISSNLSYTIYGINGVEVEGDLERLSSGIYIICQGTSKRKFIVH